MLNISLYDLPVVHMSHGFQEAMFANAVHSHRADIAIELYIALEIAVAFALMMNAITMMGFQSCMKTASRC